MITVIVYKTHDNTFSIEVSENGTPVNLITTGVDRVVVTSASEQVDSDVDASAFDYTTLGATGIIEFDFADVSDLDIGSHQCQLTIYDTAHPNGQVWDDIFAMSVRAAVVI